MAVSFDIAVMEILAGFSVSLFNPLRRLAVDGTNISRALTFAAAQDREKNQNNLEEYSFFGHGISRENATQTPQCP
jgi:hypothetical protein